MVFESEAKFQTAFLKYMVEKDTWWYKLPDTGYWLKPFDMFYVEEWRAYWMELKLFKKKELLSYEQIYKELRPNQIWGLYKFQQAWWVSLIVWYDNIAKTTKTFTFKYLKDGNKREL